MKKTKDKMREINESLAAAEQRPVEAPATITAEAEVQTEYDLGENPEVLENEDKSSTEVIEPIVNVEHVEQKKQSLAQLAEIDPDLLTGEKIIKSKRKDKMSKVKPAAKNKIEPVKVQLSNPSSTAAIEAADSKKAKATVFFIFSAIVVLIVAIAAILYTSGIERRLQSPLKINGEYVDSAEFSFIYHYILIDNGVDVFAADTPEMLSSPADDESFGTNRDYFLDLTARQMRTIQILYDDATAHGYNIESDHYNRARAYVDWLAIKAADLNVSLDTYIKGVFGNQVTEQIVLNTLAKMYFTDDYSYGAKLEELQASDEQAEEAYQLDRNTYDVVSYKILRITYEQRTEAFLNTANLHADQIIEQMGHDQALFESCAAQYFSGTAAEILSQPDSTLVRDVRYADFTHDNFRDWLFAPERTSGDVVKFLDGDGFPILLCFVSRDRQDVPLRDVRIIQVTSKGEFTGEGYDVTEAQYIAQTIYDNVNNETDMQEMENLYNDDIIAGTIVATHSADTYPGKYDSVLNDWIFNANRQAGDKAFLESSDGFYIVYMVSISEKPEWYDRVNSFVRMRNYQAFINEMETEYSYEFIQSGLDKIQDVP